MCSNNRIIIGTDGVVAENTDGVSSFFPDMLTIRSNGGIISISGDELVIVSMEEGTITVRGKIRSVSLL